MFPLFLHLCCAGFQDLIVDEADNFGELNINYFTGRSIDDALAESVSGEIFLFIATCAYQSRTLGVGVRRELRV